MSYDFDGGKLMIDHNFIVAKSNHQNPILYFINIEL